MKSVSVVCAPPNGRNPGMASVDLAFGTVAALAGLDDVTYWRLWDQSEWVAAVGGSHPTESDEWFDPDTQLSYRDLRDNIEEAFSADCVIFWGDFLHLASYQSAAADVLHTHIGLDGYSRGDVEALAARALLLDGVDASVASRTVSFGTTLSLDGASNRTPLYEQRLRSFVESVHAIWLRDAYSADVVRALRGSPLTSNLACDAAFLLQRISQRDDRDGVRVFFGRSTLAPEVLGLFGRSVSRRLGLRPSWLDWGREPALWPMNHRRRFRAAWPELEHESAHMNPVTRIKTYRSAIAGDDPTAVRLQPLAQELFEQIAGASLVLTDTYHLAVNSWRLGTPAVCVVDPAGRSWSVNAGDPWNPRDKRRDLYSRLDAQPFLVDGASLARRRSAFVARVADAVQNSEVRNRVAMRVDQITSVATSCIDRSIASVLDG